ncbi:AMP-binding protein, partial [Aeromicrobium alkaliterrae]
MTELLTLLAAHVRPGGTAPAQRFRVGGAWSTRTYGELADLVSHAASSLTQLGVGPRDRVAILLPTRADWTVVDLAAAGLGATVVPIYPTSTAVQVADLVSRSAPRVLVTEASRVLPDLGAVHVARLGDADGDLGPL